MPDKKSMRRLFSAERERLIFDELGRDAKSIEEL